MELTGEGPVENAMIWPRAVRVLQKMKEKVAEPCGAAVNGNLLVNLKQLKRE